MSSGSRSSKKSKTSKPKSKKLPSSSRQSTINHYFGGKAVPYQSTVTQFFKTQTKDNLNNTEQSTTPTSVMEDVKRSKQEDENVKEGENHDFESEQESLQREIIPSKSRNPFSKVKSSCSSSSSKEVTSVKTFTTSDLEYTRSKRASISTTKSLSLKIRKRKHRTTVTSPDQERVNKKLCKSPSASEINSSLVKNPIKIEGTTSNENDQLSSEDMDILAGYSSMEVPKHPKLSDLEVHCEVDRTREESTGRVRKVECSSTRQTDSSKQCQQINYVKDEVSQISSIHLSPPKSNSLIKKQRNLPDSPTFSPKKSTPKCFSPLLKRRPNYSLSKEGSSQIMDASLPLFSSPQEQRSDVKDVSVLSICSPPSGGLSKRALFPSNCERQPLTSLSTSTANNHQNISAEDMEDEYGFDGDLDLMNQSELLSALDVSLTDLSNRLNRYLVLEKVSQMSTDHQTEMISGRSKPEIMLRLFDEKSTSEKICYLRDDWLTTDIEPGDIVQVTADYDKSKGCFTVDNAHHYSSIVVNPDCLISSTSVANSITCVRRAVLSEKFKGRMVGSKAMTIGQLLHEVFQRVLLKRQEAGPSLTGAKLVGVVKQEMENVLLSVESLDQLYSLEMSESAAKEILSEQIPAIVDWCDKYMHQEPMEGKGDIDFKRSGASCQNTSCIAITDVLDIEENIWSPRYGLKGKVDVTVTIDETSDMNTRGHSSPTVQEDVTPPVRNVRLPLELKTGKMFRKQGTIEHRAQVLPVHKFQRSVLRIECHVIPLEPEVSLYTLMLGERYGMQTSRGGLLFYLKGGHMQGLPTLPHEIRGLINARNHLSRYNGTAGDSLSLPGLLKDKHTCKYCPCLKDCMLYHSAIEKGDKVSSGLDELFDQQVSHLSQSHLNFFAKWYSLIAEEERHSKAREGPPLWLLDPENREKEGRCHANLLAKPTSSSSPMTRQRQTFYKHTHSSASEDTLLSTNDSVVISRQDGSGWAITMGSITKPLSAGEVEVLVDKAVPSDGSTLYRIDMTPSYGGGSMAGYLADFCSSDSERDYRLRELVIDLEAPKFIKLVQCSLPQEMSNRSVNTEQILSELNSSQRNAISKVLQARDYALILGMPGTGKTTTISCLVRLLVAQGKSVLLTSYTHSAVDNILLKLQKDGIDFLRLGSHSRVHPSIQMYTPNHLCKGFRSVQELEQVYLTMPVVASTCLGVKHDLFTRRSFDVCIIDEATQITLPVSLGPLRQASVFVLVGDHYQLPPLVQSQQAREGGLDLSLFRYLSEHHPSALVSLDQQYRMNKEIMMLSNRLIYSNRLKCGSEKIASAKLHLPHLDLHPLLSPDCGTCERVKMVPWLKEAIDPQNPVLFINTDQCSSAMESIIGDHIGNLFEVDIVGRIVVTLLQFGLTAGNIGVITPLRHQQNLIQQKLKSVTSRFVSSTIHSNPSLSPGVITEQVQVEVNTIDKYQGRDKECIIVSFVRNNSKGNTGPLLKDWRRINVALTRAKHKLLMIGSYNTLKRTPLLQCLLDVAAKNKWILHLSETDL